MKRFKSIIVIAFIMTAIPMKANQPDSVYLSHMRSTGGLAVYVLHGVQMVNKTGCPCAVILNM